MAIFPHENIYEKVSVPDNIMGNWLDQDFYLILFVSTKELLASAPVLPIVLTA